jgi:two-component system response regulator ResD
MSSVDSDRQRRILLVDDEASLRMLVRRYLQRDGYLVVEAVDGAQALQRLAEQPFDLAVIDVMMPKVDGFDLVRQIRSRSDIPVIMLTGRGEESSRVAGLELGADDYMVKPFSMPELVARVRARLRRPGTEQLQPTDVLEVGQVRADSSSRRAWVGDRELDLTRREFDLLVALLAAPGRVFTRDQLLDHAWGTRYVSAKTVDVHVSGLRRKLGDAVSVQTVRGVGYRLEPL